MSSETPRTQAVGMLRFDFDAGHIQINTEEGTIGVGSLDSGIIRKLELADLYEAIGIYRTPTGDFECVDCESGLFNVNRLDEVVDLECAKCGRPYGNGFRELDQ